MIIAVIGADLNAINEISNLIVDSSCFIKIDMNVILSKMPERCKNPVEKYHWFLNSFDLQRFILKYFETEYSNIVVIGNIFLNPRVLQWILQQNDKILIAQSEHNMSETSPEFIAYENNNRYPELSKNLLKYDKSKQMKLIDLESESDIQYLDELITSLQDCKSSHLNKTEPEDLLFERIETNMTIEETLKKAMSELGIETEDVPEVPEEPASKPKPNHKTSEVKPVEPVEPTKPIKKQEESIKQEKSSSVFCKFSGNRMAIMFPVGIELEKRVIDDIELNVLTVPVPNFDTTSLQELEIYQSRENKENPVKTPEVSNVTTKKSEIHNFKSKEDIKEKPEKPKRKPAVVSNDMSLDELQSEKARLDKAIKDARAEKDLEKVDELRKQRRAVRKKINDLK